MLNTSVIKQLVSQPQNGFEVEQTFRILKYENDNNSSANLIVKSGQVNMMCIE